MTLTFDQLADRARALVSDGRRAVLGITGAPAAGKTTLAEELVAALGAGVAHVPMDGFHLADAELSRLGLLDRKGAPETFDALGYAALLRRLVEDEDEIVYAPGFERVIEQPIAGAIPIERAARLIITEGNYLLLWDNLEINEIWYADLDQDTMEFDVNYLIKTFNARISLYYLDKSFDPEVGGDTSTIGLGLQIQM